MNEMNETEWMPPSFHSSALNGGRIDAEIRPRQVSFFSNALNKLKKTTEVNWMKWNKLKKFDEIIITVYT